MRPDLSESIGVLRRGTAVAAAAVVVALALLATAIWAFSSQSQHNVISDVGFDQEFTLSYSGKPLVGTIYGTSEATTHTPLFLSSLQSLTMVAGYRFSSASPSAITGRLTASVIVDDQGLLESIMLPSKVAISADRGQSTWEFPLARYEQVMAALDRIGGPGSYPLEVLLRSDVAGKLAGQAIQRTDGATFSFTGTADVLLPATAAGAAGVLGQNGGSGMPGLQDLAAPYSKTAVSKVALSHQVPSQLSLGWLHISYTILGALGLIGALGALYLTAVAVRRVARHVGSDPRLQPAMRIAGRRIDIFGDVEPDGIPLEVLGVQDLVRASRLLELPVLHLEEPRFSTFMVASDPYVLRYRIPLESDNQEPQSAGKELRSPSKSSAEGPITLFTSHSSDPVEHVRTNDYQPIS
ncbi:MAG: hypothetical protein M1115_08405 [Actinobacteria bacterium]|nr:hypothetical protein [Actinomycetota bacterium]